MLPFESQTRRTAVAECLGGTCSPAHLDLEWREPGCLDLTGLPACTPVAVCDVREYVSTAYNSTTLHADTRPRARLVPLQAQPGSRPSPSLLGTHWEHLCKEEEHYRLFSIQPPW